MVVYSSSQLIDINSRLDTRQWIDPGVLRHLRDLNICETKPTHRGCRAGQRKQKHINVSSKKSNHHLSDNTLYVTLWHAQSVKNKTTEIYDYILESKTDVLYITETWLSPSGDESKCNELTPVGYKFKHVPRLHTKGVCIGIIYREDLSISFPKSKDIYTTFESMLSVITSGKKTLKVYCLYRPPPSKVNKLTHSDFCDEFSTFCTSIYTKSDSSIILGDLNVHYNSDNNTVTVKIVKLLDTLGLKQFINEPTHRSGSIIDWVISKDPDLIQNVQVSDKQMSDHFLVTFHLSFSRSERQRKQVVIRNWKSINIEKFKCDFDQSGLDFESVEDVNELVGLFNSTLTTLLDKHAPLKLKAVLPRDAAPWYTSEVLQEKRVRGTAERRWRKTRLEVDRQIYNAARNTVNKCIRSAKSKFIQDEVSRNSSNPRALFCTLNGLLGRDRDSSLPQGSETNMASQFNTFFTEKIAKLRNQLGSCCDDYSFQEFSGSDLEFFRPVSDSDIKKIILSSKPTSCQLDPIPTTFFIRILDIILPAITKIVNLSLSSGVFPDVYKRAVIKPLLKKPHLDTEVYGNYRPVSNVCFLSKIIEKVVKCQLMDHMNKYGLMDIYQSAYRPGHSTETALNSVMNTILTAVDSGKVGMLVLLDLSAAFDTIDHNKLLCRLKHEFGLTETVLNWFASYLTGRSQFVQIGDVASSDSPLCYGVPHGSVLGPILFVLYTHSFGTLISDQEIYRHFYADDSQLIDSFDLDPPSQTQALLKMETCLSSVKSWMTSNMLKLNADKTEALLIAPKTRLKKCILTAVTFESAAIPFSTSVKNLGVYLDSGLTMDSHISNVCKTCYFHLRNIGNIRHLITRDTAALLVRTLILTRIDYCNSLLCGISNQQLQRFQKIQNHAARIVTRSSKTSHITPILNSLHWLRIKERIDFKILCLTYQSVNHTSPLYLQDLVSPHCQTRSLRSNNQHLLQVPKYKLKSFGARSFSYNSAVLWNSLPLEVKTATSLDTFKSHLKTHLFKRYC